MSADTPLPWAVVLPVPEGADPIAFARGIIVGSERMLECGQWNPAVRSRIINLDAVKKPDDSAGTFNEALRYIVGRKP